MLSPSIIQSLGSLREALTESHGILGAQSSSPKSLGGLPGTPGADRSITKELGALAGGLPEAGFVEGSGAAEAAQTFSGALSRLIENAETKQTEADEAVKKLLSGGDIQLHQVMLATEKASLSFELLMSVRNRLLDAYQEMMRLQV